VIEGKVAAALFVRDILFRGIESAFLADLLRFESNPKEEEC
jgi:hypothetical protein